MDNIPSGNAVSGSVQPRSASQHAALDAVPAGGRGLANNTYQYSSKVKLRGLVLSDRYHLGQISCIRQLQNDVELIVFNERVEVFDHIGVIQLLQWTNGERQLFLVGTNLLFAAFDTTRSSCNKIQQTQ